MSDSTVPKDTLTRLRQELKLSFKLNQQELEPKMRTALHRYTGRFTPETSSVYQWDVILNEVYPVVQNMLPAIYFRNPRAFLKPRQKTFIAKVRDPISGQMVEKEMDSMASARTQEAILNYKVGQIRFKSEAQRCLLDALVFPHGILWHGYKGNFGMTEERSLYIEDDDVFVQRINPLRFFHDPSVPIDRLDEARWIGRSFEVSLTDLMEDDTLDVDKSLKGKLGYGTEIGTADAKWASGMDTFRPGSVMKPLSSFLDKENMASKVFRFVTVYEVFLRPSPKQKRDGETGWLVLMCDEQDKPLRVSKFPYKAKGWPAKVLQFNPLPDEPVGLSDYEVYGPIADQKNMLVNISLRNAKENSKVWVLFSKDGMSEEDIQKVQSGEQTVIGVDGPVGTNLEVKSAAGQGSAELYAAIPLTQKNLENASGVSDLQKGFLQSGEESATSAKIRQMGGSVRAAYRQDIMSDFVKDSFDFLLQLIKQYYPVDKAVRIVGSMDVQWSDDPTKESIQAETDIELDVISMLPENPEKEIQEINAILQMAFQAMSAPEITNKLAQEGYVFNFYPLIENLLMRMKLRNPEIFRKIKADESQGFVKATDMLEAGQNVTSALAGQPPPHPPQMGQDHRARLFVYNEILQLISELGDSPAKQMLERLVMAQEALAKEEEEKAGKPGATVSKAPKMKPVPAGR